MFKDSKAFSSFSVNDLQAAKKFYTEVLGLEVSDNPMGIIELHITGSNNIMVYPKPNHEPATFTVLNFLAPDIDNAVDALIVKGIVFEQYDQEYMKTDKKGIVRANGQGPNIAWFKDPAGNILSVIEDK
ncbi:VOC family protein [Mucilaginibacter sp. UR6-11]|uniref:VOC family protein n=1 Tax=Mucilaginibacter sp. UR6-11 TaxID=1435644 RepID=UPI001E4DA327|nr:VOC family protein [Mucilaginibacter sp. UR6-11]MCC8426532.1 VOC family protein [Mucilaginibacter sp. UR6-11]